MKNYKYSSKLGFKNYLVTFFVRTPVGFTYMSELSSNKQKEFTKTCEICRNKQKQTRGCYNLQFSTNVFCPHINMSNQQNLL